MEVDDRQVTTVFTYAVTYSFVLCFPDGIYCALLNYNYPNAYSTSGGKTGYGAEEDRTLLPVGSKGESGSGLAMLSASLPPATSDIPLDEIQRGEGGGGTKERKNLTYVKTTQQSEEAEDGIFKGTDAAVQT